VHRDQLAVRVGLLCKPRASRGRGVRGRGARVRGAAALVLRARRRNANRLSGRDSDFKVRGAFGAGAGAGAGAVTATEAARCVVGIVRGDGGVWCDGSWA
jgi:hypothetical protein